MRAAISPYMENASSALDSIRLSNRRPTAAAGTPLMMKGLKLS